MLSRAIQRRVIAAVVAASLALPAPASAQFTSPASFAARGDFPTGSSPQGVATADLNGDGRPDLAVTNATGNSVSVLLNTTAPGAASPSFAAKVDFTTDSGPVAVAIGDLNEDGKHDLAVANNGSSRVSVHLNTTVPGAATPTFAPKADFGVGTGPISVAISDLNGDGKLDLAVANNGSATVSVLLNTTTPGAGSPTFAAKSDVAVGAAPAGVAIGDLNGDGVPDLAVTNHDDGDVSVLFNLTAAGAVSPSFTVK